MQNSQDHAKVTACHNMQQFYTITVLSLFEAHKLRLLVKPGTPEHGTPEQHHSGTRNTGTLKILNLLKIRKKNTGGCENYCCNNYCVKRAFLIF